jgi:hypothetical protein
MFHDADMANTAYWAPVAGQVWLEIPTYINWEYHAVWGVGKNSQSLRVPRETPADDLHYGFIDARDRQDHCLALWLCELLIRCFKTHMLDG